MGWRETLGGAALDSENPTQYTQNTQNPGHTMAPEPEAVGFGGYGGFGYERETSSPPPADRTLTALRTALTHAGDRLPVSPAELVEAFGTEAEADWLEGYTPHCRPEFLRAFAVAVSERLAQERTVEPEPEPPFQYRQNTQNRKPKPNLLEGLELLRDDWRFIKARTLHRRDRASLLIEYAERWREAAAHEPIPHHRANAGRRAANSWLREITR